MKTLCFAMIWSLALSLLAQGDNASSPAYRARAKQDATDQLQEGLRTHNWKLVKESAEQLEQLEKLGQQPEPKEEDLFDAAVASGFTLSRTPDEEHQGARFGFSHNYAKDGAHTSLEADFYLKWTMPPWHNDSDSLWNSLAISAQGKLTSASDSETDAWRFRLEDTLWTYNAKTERQVDGVIAKLSAKSESDRDFDTTRLSGELWLTLNARKFGIGQYSGNKKTPIQFRWRPYLGADAGATVADETGTKELADDPLWLLVRGRADLRLNFLSNLLKLGGVIAYVDNKFVYVTEAGEPNNYLNTGIDLELNDNIGLTLQYTTGEDSPKFVREEVFKGGLTVKF